MRIILKIRGVRHSMMSAWTFVVRPNLCCGEVERYVMGFNQLEMANGTKYRALVEFNELVSLVDNALKAGGLLTIPMGITAPGTPVTINPQHVVCVVEGMY